MEVQVYHVPVKEGRLDLPHISRKEVQVIGSRSTPYQYRKED
jgi:hypothetical protein